MKNKTKEYFVTLASLFDKVIVENDRGRVYTLENAIAESIRMIIELSKSNGKLLFIGNGASAAIASHMAVDFWKNAGVRALAFNDSSLLTCISNDFGYKYVFEKPVKMFADRKDILIAISSSGQSENILRAAKAAKRKCFKVITLSGFDKNNPLRKLGDLNFYVPEPKYGAVEIIHMAICHCLVDMFIENYR